jgi:hypothetical protein
MDTPSQAAPESSSDEDTAQPNKLAIPWNMVKNALAAPSHDLSKIRDTQDTLIAWQKTKISEQDAVIANQKTKLSFQRSVIVARQGDSLLQGALILKQEAKISEQDVIIADMTAEVTDQCTTVSKQDAEIAELKKQLELERKQNSENTQLIKVMMDNGYPPPPTPTAQADPEVIAELKQQLQYSKDLVQYLTKLAVENAAKLAERETSIAEKDDLIF